MIYEALASLRTVMSEWEERRQQSRSLRDLYSLLLLYAQDCSGVTGKWP
jgi:hypothetical protein